jgi:hypothetical protein
MKKKANKEQIDNLKSSLFFKIFDIIKINSETYYLDREFNLIWDKDKQIVGIIDNNKNLFFNEMDEIIDTVKKELCKLTEKYME